MKKSILIFVIGFICGAIFLNLLCMNAIIAHKNIMRYNFSVEQEMLARRAQREGNDMRALVHCWNTVDAVCEDGFRIFRPKSAQKGGDEPFFRGDGFFFPYQAIAMRFRENMILPVDKKRMNEGRQRAQLALAMEKVALEEAAQTQWQEAAVLSSNHAVKIRTEDEIRKLALAIREFANSAKGIETEQAILGEASN